MREPLTREKIRELMTELARSAKRARHYRVYLVGGGTAVWLGWRPSTVDVDLYGHPDDLFRDVQRVKERLRVNVEFARPEDFVPALAGSDDRHVHIETIGAVSFYHHDPYAQAFSKVVRGFSHDLLDAEHFVSSGMVDADRLRELVYGIARGAFAKYPALSPDAVLAAINAFTKRVRG